LRNLELIGEAATHIPQAGDPLATSHRHPQPIDPRLPRHR
jgi:uncharacterized protein with HEPN domain